MVCRDCERTYKVVKSSLTGISIIPMLRAFVRRDIVGWPVFGYHEHGDVHEHLDQPMGVAYVQARVGGIFRRCLIADWQGNILPWAVKCSNGFLAPVTIRHRETGETFTSSAPARILAKALAATKNPYEKPTSERVANEAGEDAEPVSAVASAHAAA